MRTTEHPFSTEDLCKGSVVACATIEEAYRVQRGTDAYQLAVLRAVDFITRRLADRGLEVVCKQRKHDIVILTDAEASAELAARLENAVRGIRRNHRRLATVDVENLQSGERVDHDMRQIRSGRLWLALRDANRPLPEATDVQRLTPPKPFTS